MNAGEIIAGKKKKGQQKSFSKLRRLRSQMVEGSGCLRPALVARSGRVPSQVSRHFLAGKTREAEKSGSLGRAPWQREGNAKIRRHSGTVWEPQFFPNWKCSFDLLLGPAEPWSFTLIRQKVRVTRTACLRKGGGGSVPVPRQMGRG